MDNVIAVIVALVLFFVSWFLFGLAFNTTIPAVVFIAAVVLMSLAVTAPLWILDRLEKR
jgi:hypothetical protein